MRRKSVSLNDKDQVLNFPFHLPLPAQFQNPLPREVDVVIIGGGVIGIMTSLFLNRAGLRVLVVEKGRVAAEQSSRNWGWIRQQGRDAAEMPIMVESRRLWLELAAQSGEDFGLRQGGVTYLARKPEQMRRFEDLLALSAELGVGTRLLSAKEVQALYPDSAIHYAGAAHTPSDMRAEPWLAVPAIARLAQREGVGIIENCAARALDITNGHVSGVITELGLVRTGRVLVAGGAWSSLFLRGHGVNIPQLNLRATVAATAPLPQITTGAASNGAVAWRRREDGGYTLATGGRKQLFISPDSFRHFRHYLPALRQDLFGTQLRPFAPKDYPEAWRIGSVSAPDRISPFERMRVLDPTPDQRSLAKITRNFAAAFPTLGPIRLTSTWAGMIDAMPDFVPIIDQAPRIGGLFIGTGMSAHGFGIGPGFGRVLADLIQNKPLGHDISRFRLSRFSDGSRLQLGPAL